MSAPTTVAEPPSALLLDDPISVEDARRRFEKKSGLGSLLSSISHQKARVKAPLKRKPSSKRIPSHSLSSAPGSSATTEDIQTLLSSPSLLAQPLGILDSVSRPTPARQNTILLDQTALYESEDNGSQYFWAVVYENQRGLTMFSTPYYSQISLLPSDPDPFTTVQYPFSTPETASRKRRNAAQSFASLQDYTLPSGSWSWVSKAWMIDMRSTSASVAGSQLNTVQYDGFEYNWFFRRTGWRSEAGKFSAGGYVRRRRWVRLMVREGASPSKAHRTTDGVGTNAPSIITAPRPHSYADLEPGSPVWTGGSSDMRKCTKAMTMTGRDGTKLELWARWLRLPKPVSSSGRQKLWTEDNINDSSGSSPSSPLSPSASSIMLALEMPSLEQVKLLLNNHGADILQLFTYPDSRAHFLEMLESAGLRTELTAELGPELQFWSYHSQASVTSPPEASSASRGHFTPNGERSQSLDIELRDAAAPADERREPISLNSPSSPTSQELKDAVTELLTHHHA